VFGFNIRGGVSTLFSSMSLKQKSGVKNIFKLVVQHILSR